MIHADEMKIIREAIEKPLKDDLSQVRAANRALLEQLDEARAKTERMRDKAMFFAQKYDEASIFAHDTITRQRETIRRLVVAFRIVWTVLLHMRGTAVTTQTHLKQLKINAVRYRIDRHFAESHDATPNA